MNLPTMGVDFAREDAKDATVFSMFSMGAEMNLPNWLSETVAEWKRASDAQAKNHNLVAHAWSYFHDEEPWPKQSSWAFASNGKVAVYLAGEFDLVRLPKHITVGRTYFEPRGKRFTCTREELQAFLEKPPVFRIACSHCLSAPHLGTYCRWCDGYGFESPDAVLGNLCGHIVDRNLLSMACWHMPDVPTVDVYYGAEEKHEGKVIAAGPLWLITPTHRAVISPASPKSVDKDGMNRWEAPWLGPLPKPLMDQFAGMLQNEDGRLPAADFAEDHGLNDLAAQLRAMEITPEIRQRYAAGERCHAGKDGDCIHKNCPQNRDGEPGKSGRDCPFDTLLAIEKEGVMA